MVSLELGSSVDVVAVDRGSSVDVVAVDRGSSVDVVAVDRERSHYNLHLMAGRLAPASEVAGGHTLPF
jgi:hypothetical protein